MKLPLIAVCALTFVPAFVSPEGFWPNRQASSIQGENGRSSQDPSELNGTYLCEGMRPDGNPYHGTVRIVRHNGAYQLLWSVGSEEQYLGIGIVNGDVLAVSYFGGAPGVVAYRIERASKSARLVGQWTVANANGRVFGETLTRLTREVTAPPQLPDVPQRRPERLQPSARTKPA